MKSLMTAIGLLLATSLGNAKQVQIQTVLECKAEAGSRLLPGIKSYMLVQTINLNAKTNAKTNAKADPIYTLVVMDKSGKAQVGFKNSDSGDEDYNSYRVKANAEVIKKIGVSSANIHQRFEWATLINENGEGFVDCR